MKFSIHTGHDLVSPGDIYATEHPRRDGALFDHLVGALLETPRHVEVKRLDFLEIDHLSLPKIISGRNDGATRVAPT